jgi:hypothetical protein
MEAYDFSSATQRVYAFWQNELCDVFIEVMKPVMAYDDANVSPRRRAPPCGSRCNQHRATPTGPAPPAAASPPRARVMRD